MTFNSSWLSDWAKRIEITIDHDLIDEDINDFPLFLNLRNSCGTNSADVMSGMKAELSEADYDFSDDFTSGEINLKTWSLGTPTGASFYVADNKLTMSGTTVGTNLYAQLRAYTRWNFITTSFSLEYHSGYDAAETDSEYFLLYTYTRDKDNPSTNYAMMQVIYDSASYGPTNPMMFRSRIVNGGASTYGTSYYHNPTSWKTRHIRSGSTMTLYYDVGGGWITAGSSSIGSWSSNTETFHLLYNYDYSSGDTTLVAYVDNFVVNSGTIRHFYGRQKMAITDENGTQLPVELEDLQFRLNRCIAWTKVPTVYADRDTKLYLYYDYTKTDNTDYIGELGDAAAKNVWDSDYIGVYHMENDGSSPSGSNSVKDSTSLVNHGTPNSTPNLLTAKAGRGLNFDPSSTEYVNMGGNLSELDGKSSFTLSFVLKADVVPFDQYRAIFARGSGGQRVPWVYCNSGSSVIVCQCEMADASQPSRTISISQDVWTAIDFVWTGDNLQRYKDGEWAGSQVATNTTTVANTDGYNYIGYMDGYYSFDGILDEVRISKTDRSGSYIKASYNSTWDTLVSYGPEQNYPPSVISGTVHDKYSRLLTEPCNVIVSDLDGEFVVSDVTDANGHFEIGVPASPDERFVVTFYKPGRYGLDYDVAGAMFMTPVATTSG